MQSILDVLGGNYDDPRTQGLLTLGLKLLGTQQPRFGQALSEAGLGAMQAYEGAQRNQQQRQTAQMQRQMQQLQLQRAQEEQARAARQEEARSRYLADMSGNMGPPPEMNPWQALAAGIQPAEMKMLQGPAPAAPMKPMVLPDGTVLSGDGRQVIREAPRASAGGRIGVVNPEAWTPESLAKYQQSGDPSVLRRFVASPQRASGPPSAPTPAPTQQAANERGAVAAELGVPVADRDPFANMRGPQADIFKRNLYQQADKKLNEMDESASTARGMARDMQRFLHLQRGVSMQGPIAGRVIPLTSDAQEMDAITDKITPKMREPGSGATSDFDAKMFRNSTVSRTKNDQANEAIGQAVILQTQNTSDRAQFMRDYLTVNGHLDGADRQWARYLNANPIFDPKSPEVPRLNAARVPYQQFFGGAQQAAPAQPGASNALTPAEQKELEDLRRRFPGAGKRTNARN
jgi:hypothetical protein